jgi:NitT/TauT family transport system permease protein
MKRTSAWVMPIVGGVVLIALWYIIVAAFHFAPYVLPTPVAILKAALHERQALLGAALITGQGAVLGFLAAAVVGFVLSAIMAIATPIKQAFYPYILIFQMTPVIILTPVFVLWWGQGLPSIVAVTFVICFFPIVANTTMGMVSTDRDLQELFVLCKASRLQQIRYLRAPAALPYFLTGLKIAGTLAPIGAITGDFLAGTSQNGVGGIGFMTIAYFSQLKIPELFATGLVACLLGFLFVGGVNVLHWFVLHRWHDSLRKAE